MLIILLSVFIVEFTLILFYLVKKLRKKKGNN
jgi:hypothetical protein